MNYPPIWSPPAQKETPLSAKVLPPARKEFASGVVDDETACVQCGYNLHTLSTQGRCPECGLNVAESLRSDRLAWSDPHWRDYLTTGIAIQCWTVGLYTLIIPLLFISALFHRSGWLHIGSLALSVDLLLFVSYWLLTTAEYGKVERPGATLRRVFRVVMTITASWQIFFYVVPLGNWVLTAYSRLGLAVMSIVTACLFLLYVRQFSRRVPDRAAVRQWTILIFVTIIGYLLSEVLPGLWAIAQFDPRRSASFVYFTIGTLLGFGQSIWMFFLLLRLRKQLRAAPPAG